MYVVYNDVVTLLTCAQSPSTSIDNVLAVLEPIVSMQCHFYTIFQLHVISLHMYAIINTVIDEYLL